MTYDQLTPLYRSRARKDLFENHVSFEPSNMISSKPIELPENGFEELNQPFSSNLFLEVKIPEDIDIKDNYLCIDNEFNVNTRYNTASSYVTDRP